VAFLLSTARQGSNSFHSNSEPCRTNAKIPPPKYSKPSIEIPSHPETTGRGDLSGKDKMLRIDVADCIYKEIQEWYNTFINSIDGKKCIAVFDTAMPSYRNKLTDVKKIDYLLWSKR
jgi:hypothetical protein